ncbi:glycosyltransferase family 2 protein [Leucobacter denitrificans]|uniref:Glycosyltransferase n=1 Tax=Leucobacter denitrificans TaxID=683042 RepID=A0A7G9S3K6_9MICO|nr:glycosyltransferase [Leucobacter denitrificans]QNN62431.1 glycosyltransferase [Leucobacter denitrificans]
MSIANLSLDVIIPVHNVERPIRRSVLSVISAKNPRIRALVIAHNIPRESILRKLKDLDLERLQVIEHRDGVFSPAGPKNAGIDASSATYIAFLDSDDEYEIGALDAFCNELQSASSPDLLIGQLRGTSQGRIMAPLPRVRRFENLDPVKDLLNNRTAPIGVMIRREVLKSTGAPRFSEGYPIGEDIELGLYLWNQTRSISYSRYASGYLVHEDGTDRVTGRTLSVESALAPVARIVQMDWFKELSPQQKTAACAKLIKFQVLRLCHRLESVGPIGPLDREAARNVLWLLLRMSPNALGLLTPHEARAARVLGSTENNELGTIFRTSKISSFLDKFLTHRVTHIFNPAGGLRVAIRLIFVPATLKRFRQP